GRKQSGATRPRCVRHFLLMSAMPGFPHSLQLLHSVRRRLMLQRLVSRMFLVTLALAGIYAAALLAGRLTGLWATWFEPWTVLLVPATALALAALWPRRPGVQDAAHVIDQQQQTKDLFLTLTMLDSCPGEYQPLVGRDAELRAPNIKPAEVVPLQWERPTFIS